MRFPTVPAVVLSSLLFFSGCITARQVTATVGSTNKAFQEVVGDPVALSTVKTIMVCPFATHAEQEGFDEMLFATKFANHIASHGKLKVIYPRQMMEIVDKVNREIRRHNVELRQRNILGISLTEARPDMTRTARAVGKNAVADMDENSPRRRIDPTTNLEDALRIGNLLKADAIIVGEVTDFDPYMRPRLALSIRVVGTGRSERAAQMMAELAQWGVPRLRGSAKGTMWLRQQNFDSRDGNIGFGAVMQSVTHHTDNHPYDKQVYLRSISMYYDYVSTVLANSLMKARNQAFMEAEDRAMAEAKKRRESEDAMRRRIRAVMETDNTQLPDPDAVINKNLPDRKDRSWRPDIYLRKHPDKAAKLYAPEQRR